MIQRQLAGSATVTESKEFPCKADGKPVEVDIAIEAKVGGFHLAVGIEVTERKRPADKHWVDLHIGKHKDLSIHRTILVSKSGFTRGAIEKAKLNGFDTVTFEKAGTRNWAGIIEDLRNLELGSFVFSPLDVVAEYTDGKQKRVSSNMLVTTEGCPQDITANDYVLPRTER